MRVPIRTPPSMTLGLAVMNAFLVVAVFVHLQRGTQTAALLATPAHPVLPPLEPLDLPPGVSKIEAVQEAPLFYSSRHFFSPPSPSSVPTTPPAPEYRVVGTILVPRKSTVAWLARTTGGQTRKVTAGDDLDGWTVDSVERARVTLHYKETTMEIWPAVRSAPGGITVSPLIGPAQAGQTGVRALGAGHSSAARTAATTQHEFEPRLYQPPKP